MEEEWEADTEAEKGCCSWNMKIEKDMRRLIYTPRTRLSPVKLKTPTKMKYHQRPEFSQVYFIEFYHSGWNELTEGLQSRLRCFRSPIFQVLGLETFIIMFTLEDFSYMQFPSKPGFLHFFTVNVYICWIKKNHY